MAKARSSPVRRASRGATNLWDDLARPLHHHPVADEQALAADVVLVVQGCHPHRGSAHVDRLQDGVWVQAAGAPHVDAYVQQPGDGLGGGELVGYGPSRLPAHVPQALLVVEPVYLHNHAIGPVVQILCVRDPLPIVRLHLLWAAAHDPVRVDLEAKRLKVRQGLPLAVGRVAILA